MRGVCYRKRHTEKGGLLLFYFFIDFLSLLEDLVSALKAEVQGAGA